MPAAPGGAERRVGTMDVVRGWWGDELEWSPDGKWLAIGGRPSAADDFGLWLLEVNGLQRRRLTAARAQGWQVDVKPVFSPDGRRPAFIRLKASNNALFVLPLSPALTPAGGPIPVLNDPRRVITSVAWTPDNRSLVYAWGGHVAPSRLSRMLVPSEASAPHGEPELLPFGDRAEAIMISVPGRLVYSAALRDTNFWKLDLTRPASVPEDADLTASTLDETTPAYSPDGKQVVFTSTCSGSEELYISNVDGTGLRRMTSMGGPQVSNAQWSPGQTILFNSSREGSTDLYVLSPVTLELQRLTTDPGEEFQAHWSRDGRWIYFCSNRTSRSEIWKMPANGGTATQVTHAGGRQRKNPPRGNFSTTPKRGPHRRRSGACPSRVVRQRR